MKNKLAIFLLAHSLTFASNQEISMFIKPGDPLLQKVVAEVQKQQIATQEIQEIIDQMFVVAGGERGSTEKRGLVGLAAPQIGVAKRIILVDVGVDDTRKEWGELRVYINPEIIWKSSEEIIGREGCFSVDRHVVGLVPRASSIKIVALDRFGNLIEEEFSGFTARIFQHEIDHLNGVRFPDRIDNEGALHLIKPDQYLDYRKHWENWPVTCPRQVWLNMKEDKPYDLPLRDVVFQDSSSTEVH